MSFNNNRSFRHRSDDKLGEILEAAELRKKAEWERKGRSTTLIIVIPLIALAIWAGVFLLRYQPPAAPIAETKLAAPATASVSPAEDQKDMEQFDSFRPNSQRVVKRPESTAPSGQIVDKSDIDFAMRILNFGQAADKAGAPKK